MSIARRQMIQALAGVPFVGPMVTGAASQNLAKALGSIPLAGAKTPMNSAGFVEEPCQLKNHPLDELFGKGGYDSMQAYLRTFEEEQAASTIFRVSGIEPDIAALKSVTPAYRKLKQRTRDLETLDILARARKSLSW